MEAADGAFGWAWAFDCLPTFVQLRAFAAAKLLTLGAQRAVPRRTGATLAISDRGIAVSPIRCAQTKPARHACDQMPTFVQLRAFAAAKLRTWGAQRAVPPRTDAASAIGNLRIAVSPVQCAQGKAARNARD